MSAAISSLEPVLIANRGEVAVRIARTAGELGLRSVAVFTPQDSGAAHVRACDLAVRVDSYLEGPRLIDAAARTGARSVHPGYGFLSENGRFAREVEEAGLVWIGPPPAAIEIMADKARSKELAREAGVPVVPGTRGADADEAAIEEFAAEHGYPVLVKALAGGGGKGMRVITEAAELADGLAAARREAESAFGDGRVLVERYLERPRHIEIQVLADDHGNFVHLGERECSLQRRHQKVIEEAPSPAVDEAMRERMGTAAIDLARACDYRGAGTVELIVPAGSGEFLFLEMNTRLQVEHPVTELVWGVDLVAEQLRIAAGGPIGFDPQALRPNGHAVEARLYAEDPAAGFLPATGTVHRWRPAAGPGLRVDAGLREGGEVGTDYDPMIAKVCAHGPDRATALRRLDRALSKTELLGLRTNAAFSRALIARPEVAAGELDTGLLERLLEEVTPQTPADLLPAAALVLWADETSELTVPPGLWRRSFVDAGEVVIEHGRLTTTEGEVSAGIRDLGDGRALVELDGIARTYAVAIVGGSIFVAREGHHLEARIESRRRGSHAAAGGSLEAPMPGTVLSVGAADGDEVTEGQTLMVLESMKMELDVSAPRAGVVSGLDLERGDRVDQGQVLCVVEADDADSHASADEKTPPTGQNSSLDREGASDE
ncbi:MAG: biotin carboxylase N-terminal domain-containing protein [Solirubrobacterales bacterium]